MKNFIKVKKTDRIAQIIKSKKFKDYEEEAERLIKLGIELYEARVAKNLSQQKLAKSARTTQKIISKIENGEINVGFNLLSRLCENLNLNFKIDNIEFGKPLIYLQSLISPNSGKLEADNRGENLTIIESKNSITNRLS